MLYVSSRREPCVHSREYVHIVGKVAVQHSHNCCYISRCGSVRINLSDVDAGLSCSAMSNPVSFRYFKTSPEIIQLAVMLYVRFPLSLRNVEDLLHERGEDISYESVRHWWHRFGSQFARQIKK